MRPVTFSLFVASLLAASLRATTDPFAALPPAASNALHAGIASLYLLDLDEALSAFRHATEVATNHPAPPLYLALASTMRAACLGSSAELTQATRRSARRALALAHASLRTATDPWAHLYAAAALAFLASHISHDSRHVDGALLLKRALAHLEAAARITATSADARTLLGAYHFFLSSTPWFVQHFASLFLLPLDPRRGLRDLDYGVSHARLLKIEARMLAAVAHAWAGNPARAQHLAASLTNRFPTNPQFPLLLQHVLLETGSASAALVSATTTLAYVECSPSPYVRALLPDQHYACGLAYAAISNYSRALTHFGAAAALATHKPYIRSWAFLSQGTMHDRLGDRHAARTCYRAAIAVDRAPHAARAHAQQLLSHPCTDQSSK